MASEIRRLRLERGWSQEDLAGMAGISARTLQRAEQGRGSSAETLKCLAAVLEVDLSQLRAAAAEAEDTQPPGALEEFHTHLTIYVGLNVLLLVLNLYLTPGYLWVIWSLLGWGFAVALHAMSVYRPFRGRATAERCGGKEPSKA